MRASLNICKIIALVLFPISVTSRAYGFEQMSYFVIDLTQSTDSEALAGRLAVPQAALAGNVAKKLTSSTENRGEFEIDYVENVGSTGNSTFEFELPLNTTPQNELESINFSTSDFDFSSGSHTVFGE